MSSLPTIAYLTPQALVLLGLTGSIARGGHTTGLICEIIGLGYHLEGISYRSIHTAAEALEKRGLVTITTVRQGRWRRSYVLTTEGQEELRKIVGRLNPIHWRFEEMNKPATT